MRMRWKGELLATWHCTVQYSTVQYSTAAGHLEPLAPPVVVLQSHPQPLQPRHHGVLLVEAEEGEAGEHIDTHIWHHIHHIARYRH